MGKKIIIAIILFFSVLLLFGCVTGDIYCTYLIKGMKQQDIGYDWVLLIPNREYEKNHSGRSEKRFKYLLWDTEVGNGSIFLRDYPKSIFTEPYSISMIFSLDNDDVKNIFVSKMNLRTKNSLIDLREGVFITIKGIRDREKLGREYLEDDYIIYFTEKELTEFGSNGIIDLFKLKDEWYRLDYIQFFYKDIDIKFKRDHYFEIEYDITIETNTKGFENYSFTIRYNRRRVSEKLFLPFVL
jgi:hypothetical protein